MIDIAIDIANEQQAVAIDETRLRQAIGDVLVQEQGSDHRHGGAASISLALVDDARIHQLNRTYLGHDYATDVLSFVLEKRPGYLEGEIVISAEMAARRAAEFGWSVQDELLLYVVHGTLHLVGFDDQQPEERSAMAQAEARALRRLGIEPRGLGSGAELPPANLAGQTAGSGQGGEPT